MYGYNTPYLNYQPNYNYNQSNQTAPQDERIWVSNQQAAESYLISPSGFVRLWDSSTNRFYEKRADVTGRPLPMDIYEYSRVLSKNDVPNAKVDNLPIEEINTRIDEITSRIEVLEKSRKGSVKNAKQSDADDTSI